MRVLGDGHRHAGGRSRAPGCSSDALPSAATRSRGRWRPPARRRPPPTRPGPRRRSTGRRSRGRCCRGTGCAARSGGSRGGRRLAPTNGLSAGIEYGWPSRRAEDVDPEHLAEDRAQVAGPVLGSPPAPPSPSAMSSIPSGSKPIQPPLWLAIRLLLGQDDLLGDGSRRSGSAGSTREPGDRGVAVRVRVVDEDVGALGPKPGGNATPRRPRSPPAAIRSDRSTNGVGSCAVLDDPDRRRPAGRRTGAPCRRWPT